MDKPIKFITHWVMETEASNIKEAKEEIRSKYRTLRNLGLKLDPKLNDHGWTDETDYKDLERKG